MKTITPDITNFKMVGRTHIENDTLWLSLSGSGMSFTFTGKELDVSFVGDSTTPVRNPQKSTNLARVAIYIDNVCTLDKLISKKEMTFPILVKPEKTTVNVRIVKLSEGAMSTVGIKCLHMDENATITSAEKKPHTIEFIGDSITCGYGVEDENCMHHFSTATENVTKAYAYKTAEILNADYSIFSLSGYGIITGYCGDGETKVPQQIIPPLYTKFGYANSLFNKNKTPQSIEWDFSLFTPEVVVINLGTNDDSWCMGKIERSNEYELMYVKFLKLVREKNPNARILCMLGTMGRRLCPSVEKAVLMYSTETSDQNISVLLMPDQLVTDGYGADFHPTERTHIKVADTLSEEIKRLMKW